MKVILVMVMSIDSKTTKWAQPNFYEWTSQEDQDYFASLIKKNNAIIMGRKTFTSAQSIIKPHPQKIKIIMTKTPQKYQKLAVPGQLEFSNKSPKEILKDLEKQGKTQVLLVGGEKINTPFFEQNLINEIWLTIEPKLFGTGTNLVIQKPLDIQLQLKSLKKLNPKGTLLLKYKVITEY